MSLLYTTFKLLYGKFKINYYVTVLVMIYQAVTEYRFFHESFSLARCYS